MLTRLECTRCGEHYSADRPQSVCSKDGGILYARYDLPTIKRGLFFRTACRTRSHHVAL